MAVAELQTPPKSGRSLADGGGVCATTLSAVEKARTQKKPALFTRHLNRIVPTPYYAVSEARGARRRNLARWLAWDALPEVILLPASAFAQSPLSQNLPASPETRRCRAQRRGFIFC